MMSYTSLQIHSIPIIKGDKTKFSYYLFDSLKKKKTNHDTLAREDKLLPRKHKCTLPLLKSW